MRKVITRGNAKLVAFTSQHTVILAIGWPKGETKGLLGFAIRKSNPDSTKIWLEGLLSFACQPGQITGHPIPSNEGPFQKMYWADYQVRAGQTYGYEVIPCYGDPCGLEVREADALQVSIRTEDNRDPASRANQVYFNRAVIASQAYVRNFGDADPKSDPKILAWLARGLDHAIVDFINRANTDRTMKLDVAAYHLENPAIVAALSAVGDRARVSICWRTPDDKKRGRPAAKELTKHGVDVYERELVPAISHNKYVILKDAQDRPQAVLMGSTNFTVSGVSLQSNVSHILENPELASLYRDNFELVIAEDNNALKDANATWERRGNIELNFSPHAKKTAVDLERYQELVEGAESSIFFATLRATAANLLDAITHPKHKGVVVRGIVDRTYQQTDGDVILYHEANEKDPAVAPAGKMTGFTDPLSEEQGRLSMISPIIHHKFIVIDHDTPNAKVITGSANYSNNSSLKNDENTLIIHDDQRVAQMYVAELFRLYEHYRARWLLSRKGKKAPKALYLVEDDSWVDKYYGDAQAAGFLRNLLGT